MERSPLLPISFNIQHLTFNILVESGAMKRLFLFYLLAVACSPHEDGRLKPAATQQHVMKVGLLTPGSVNDNGWNAIAYEGLQRIHRELGAEVSHQETK